MSHQASTPECFACQRVISDVVGGGEGWGVEVELGRGRKAPREAATHNETLMNLY